MTQKQQILKHLRTQGSLTALIASKKYGIYRLAARIHNLKKDGHLINAPLVTRRGKTFAAYSLVSA